MAGTQKGQKVTEDGQREARLRREQEWGPLLVENDARLTACEPGPVSVHGGVAGQPVC